LHSGADPEGKLVCHSCDVGLCVNPAHLFIGTTADNIADKVAKNRQGRGTGVGIAKLTDTTAIAIRRLYAGGGISMHRIADAFGVSPMTIHRAIRSQTWKHVH